MALNDPANPWDLTPPSSHGPQESQAKERAAAQAAE